MDKLTSDQQGEFLNTFQDLGICPDFSSPENLKQWMIEYAKSQTKEPKMEIPSSSHHTSPGYGSKSTPSTMVLHLPKIDRFAGGKSVGKNDISYDVWRFRVIQLLNSDLYSEGVITQAVQQCLTGEAARVVVGLGGHAKVGDIIRKFDSIYGDLEKEEHILGEFYKTLQRDDEDVSTWGCRLEDLMNKAVKKGMIDPAVAYEKLRTRFWEGLRQELKDASGHKFDTIKDFDDLRVELREIEQNKKHRKEETQQGKKLTTSKMAIKSENQSHQDFSQFASALQQLTTEVASIKTHLNVQQSKNPLHYPAWNLPPPQKSQSQRYGMQQQRQRFSTPPPQSSNFGATYNRQNQRGGYQGNRYGQTFTYKNERPTMEATNNTFERNPTTLQTTDDDTLPTCWNCGQIGHIKIGCRVRTDHLRSNLNGPRPATRGGR